MFNIKINICGLMTVWGGLILEAGNGYYADTVGTLVSIVAHCGDNGHESGFVHTSCVDFCRQFYQIGTPFLDQSISAKFYFD